jgi:hypothetical protein
MTSPVTVMVFGGFDHFFAFIKNNAQLLLTMTLGCDLHFLQEYRMFLILVYFKAVEPFLEVKK